MLSRRCPGRSRADTVAVLRRSRVSGAGHPVSGREGGDCHDSLFFVALNPEDAGMGTAPTLLLHICVIFVAARLAGELCERLGQPAVIGELLIGMVLGPYALGWIGVPSNEMIEAL